MESDNCQLLTKNTASFVESRNETNNYQKISTLMCTDYWIPSKDHLKDILQTYLKYKKISKVKHWLNELRMVYNACPFQNDYVYNTLYFNTYPITFTEIIIIYTWFFDVLQHIYDKEKNSTFSASLFFKEMFREDLDNCSKHLFLNNENTLVSINIVKGKAICRNSFIKMFEKLVVNSKSYSLLTLVHLYSCFKDYYFLNCSSFSKFLYNRKKPKPGFGYYKDADMWLRRMLSFINKQLKNSILDLYQMFQPQLNDYLVCIPNGTNLKQFPIKYDILDNIIPNDALIDKEKLTVIDLLVNASFIQIHTEYLETLNMYLYISKYQTSSSLIEEMKCLFYKFRPLEELKSTSDGMMQRSLENYNVSNRKSHNLVFQQWLVQKMKTIMGKNINLFSLYSVTLYANYKELILERYFLNNLPSSEQKAFFTDIIKAHNDHSWFTILLNFFVSYVEYKNIFVKILPSKNSSIIGTQLGYHGANSIEVVYKDETIKLNQDDLNLWNMLFNQDDIKLNKVNAWVSKVIKELCQNCEKKKIKLDSRKFCIPLCISNLYLNHLNKNTHRLSSYIIYQINEFLKFSTACRNTKLNYHETVNIFDSIAQDFVQEFRSGVKIITDKNVQLVVNVINYVHCFLGIRKFHVDKTENVYTVHQNQTFDSIDSSSIRSASNDTLVCSVQDQTIQTPSSLPMNKSNHVDNSVPSKANVIQTEAIIEHKEKEPGITLKRPLKNGFKENESTKRKKSRSDEPNEFGDVIIVAEAVNSSPGTSEMTTSSRPTPTDFQNVIINESSVLSKHTKVTVFEDQFKKKLNNLTKEYSDLIDITNVKIKQEKETSSKIICISDGSVAADSGNVCNDSSDESDVIVLGPGPPKQFDVITLSEDGEEIKDISDGGLEVNKKIDSNNKENEDEEETHPVEEQKSTSVDEEEVEDEEEQMASCTYPKRWTQEMLDFYTEPVHPDQYKQKIQNQVLRVRPDYWRFEYHNSFRFHDPQFGYNKICDNCCSRLHDVKNCPQPCFNVCPMCGHSGHSPDKCPQSQCLNCGKKTDEYLFNCDECDQKVVLKIKCDICHRLYHSSDHCPHVWRSMEFTTRKGKLKVVPGGASSTNTKYCSNCAGRNHLIEECPHLSAEHPLRQDSTWKVLTNSHAAYLVHYKLRTGHQVSRVLLSQRGMSLLQKLSNQSGVSIEFLVNEGANILTYKANPVQSHFIRSQLKKYLFAS